MNLDMREVEILLIHFLPDTSAYERNMLIKHELEKKTYKIMIMGILIKPDGSRCEKIYEDHELEEAIGIEISYTVGLDR